MKKLLILLMAVFLVLSFAACGGNEIEPEPTPTPDPEEDVVTTTYEPEDEPEPETKRPTSLGITFDEIIDALPAPTNDRINRTRAYANENGNRVATNIHGIRKMFAYHEINSDYISTVIFRLPADNTGTLGIEAFDTTMSLLTDESIWPYVTNGQDTFGEWRLYVISIEHDSSFDFSQLLFSAAEKATTDFFASEYNIEQYTRFWRSGDFQALYDLVNNHFEQGNTQLYDSAWQILDLLSPIMEVIDQITVVYDAFDDVATVFYHGLTDVSRSQMFIPYATTVRNDMNILVGFHHSGWIFSDRARLRLENGETLTCIIALFSLPRE